MKKFKIWTIVMATVLTVSIGGMPAFSQDAPSKQKSRENIITLMMMRMTQALELTEEQTAAIFPRITRDEKEKREINMEIRNRMHRIRQLTEMENPGTEELETELTDFRRLRQRLQEINREFETFLESRLTLEQQARYVLFAQEFYQNLRENLNRARSLRKRGEQPTKRNPR